MKLLSTKIKLAFLVAFWALGGLVLDVLAGESQADSNDSYMAMLDTPKDDQYNRRTSPVLHQDSVPDKRSKKTYSNFGVGSAVTTGNETSASAQRAEQGIGQDGYAVQPATTNLGSEEGFQRRRVDPQSAQSPQNKNARRNDAAYDRQAATSGYGGYAVRSAGGRDVNQKAVPATSSQGNAAPAPGYSGYEQPRTISMKKTVGESYDGYEVRSPGATNQKSTPKKSDYEEDYEGYAVKSAGGAENKSKGYTRQSNTYYDNYDSGDRTSRLYRLYEGTKYYDRKGHRASLNSSKANGIVIIMPKEGKAVLGTVVQDRPGSYIVIETPQGSEISFNYDDIDSLIGI